MNAVQLESEVGADGVLELRVPLGAHDARKRVIVTIEPLPPSASPSVPGSSDWHEFVERTYGSCAGMGLEEPADLPLEQRDWPE
jgi:hypothetical protein